jgi:hypothetical protein
MTLIQESLDFEFLSANSMGFIPVELSLADLSALEPNQGRFPEFAAITRP